MTDDFRGLVELDHPADPDPEWADRLFATLAMELGYRGGPRLFGRRLDIRRWVGIDAAHRARTALRLAFLVALLGLLMAAIAAALLLAGQLQVPSPAELARRSQVIYD